MKTPFPFVWLGSLSSGSGIVIALTIWFVLVGCVYGCLQRYVGYMIKAGHVAMVTTAVTTGSLPVCHFLSPLPRCSYISH